jgi:hypothetical protein
MNKKAISILITMLLISSAFTLLTRTIPSAESSFVEPDYVRIDAANTPSGSLVVDEPLVLPGHHSYYNIGDVATWIRYNFYTGGYGTSTFTLKAITTNAELWVQNNLGWPVGDPRAYPIILPNETQFLINEFEDLIYPTDINYFGAPMYRNGSDAAYGPPGYYLEPTGRTVILVSNIRDTNYYNPSYPYYVAGYFSTGIQYYTGRNVVTIDSWRWERRLGPYGTVWLPPSIVDRPYVYDSTVAHEFQHLIHADWNPNDPSFMNEGCSMYAEYLCGFGIDPTYINSYFATPDNSLTEWGDQGDINILADYGESALWVIYISDHYGGSNTIRYFVQNGIPGIDGVNAALAHFGYVETFDAVFYDWRLANLIHSGKYNYISLNLNAYIPVRQYKIIGFPVPLKKGTDFGNTITILDYDTGVSRLAPYGTDYITFEDWSRPGFIYFDGDDLAQLGWTMTTDGWWSGLGNMLDYQLISQVVNVNPADPTLTLVTKYGLESNWDFGFVQVSTDNGQTWTSLANAYTTSSYLTDVPAIYNKMPGLTDYNPDWPGLTTMTFDLSAYAGSTVMINFRYMTDEGANYEGWFINSASISGTALTFTAYPPYPKASFQVTAVKAVAADGKYVYIPYDLRLDSNAWTGEHNTFAKSPTYIVLVVSPTMHQGTVDYQFRVYKK